jgi:hypothetical protein
MNEQNGTTATENGKPLNGRLTIYHANGKGTGAAMRLELKLSRDGEERNSCFFLVMARQKTAATREGDQRRHATFDWENKATVKLGFSDVCELLMVLEGRQAQAGGTRNGLYHETAQGNTLIAFKKSPEPAGYGVGISRKDKQGQEVFRGHLLLSEAEALGVQYLLRHGLFHMVFHASL